MQGCVLKELMAFNTVAQLRGYMYFIFSVVVRLLRQGLLQPCWPGGHYIAKNGLNF